MKRLRLAATVFLALLGMALWGPGSRAADATIKIGYIDPFSGAFAQGGDASLKMFQFIVDYINDKGGALGKKFELVTFDDKLQPAEALIALKSVIDQNLPFVMSCVGSNVGSALIDAVTKHNTRNPDNRLLQLNCGQLATELTNEQCSFWHFRFVGSVEMRAVARIKSLPQSVKIRLPAQPGLPVRPVDREGHQTVPRPVPPRHQDRRRRVHPADAGQGFLARTSPRSRRPARSRCSPETTDRTSIC